MSYAIRTFLGAVAFALVLPFSLVTTVIGRRRRSQKRGLIPMDRDIEIARKFGSASARRVNALLDAVENPTEKVLGAIIFLAKSADQVEGLVKLANGDRDALLNAAQVKDERA